ncbi:MAG: hypothetical protein KKG75_04195 [Nanoarchaeota archaeon]|nr:hypothetical protein [Nanoarchaeota archaeon]
MNLKNVIEKQSPISRRDALKVLATSTLFGCGNGSVTGTGNGQPRLDPPETDPPGDYTQFTAPEYVAQIGSNSQYVDIPFRNKYGYTSIFPIGEDGFTTEIGSFTAGLYENDQEQVVGIYERKNRVAPGLKFTSKRPSSKPISGDLVNRIRVYAKEKMIQGRDVAIRQIEESAPEWDPEHVINMPGIIYRGDWSFNQIRELNTTLNYASTVLTFIPGPQQPAAATVSAITDKLTPLFGYTSELIDIINSNTPLSINKNAQFSWYEIQGMPNFPIIVPSAAVDRIRARSAFEIEDFYPLTAGNQWRFSSNQGEFGEESLGFKDIKGKKVVVVRNTKGEDEYYGCRNGQLKLMGARSPEIGDFYFEPGIVIGDSNIRTGRIYVTESNVVFDQYPHIEGTMAASMDFQALEHITVPAGEFGDCLKARELGTFDMRNTYTGEKARQSGNTNHWLAKNVGHVKMQELGNDGRTPVRTYRLQRADINGISIQKPLTEKDMSFGVIKIAENLCKELI